MLLFIAVDGWSIKLSTYAVLRQLIYLGAWNKTSEESYLCLTEALVDLVPIKKHLLVSGLSKLWRGACPEVCRALS